MLKRKERLTVDAFIMEREALRTLIETAEDTATVDAAEADLARLNERARRTRPTFAERLQQFRVAREDRRRREITVTLDGDRVVMFLIKGRTGFPGDFNASELPKVVSHLEGLKPGESAQLEVLCSVGVQSFGIPADLVPGALREFRACQVRAAQSRKRRAAKA